jgi:hypothetical protein
MRSDDSCQTSGMRHALLVTLVVLAYIALIGVAFVCMAGLTRAVYRTGERRQWRLGLLLPASLAAALVAFMGGWVIYLLLWPFLRLRRTREPASDRRGWQWTAPPDWPAPPAGFAPPPGWSPDPAWPAPGSGHVFWIRTPRGRWQRRATFAAAALSVLLPAGCVAAAATMGSCAFDPPPGDQLTRTITNDTASEVALLECDDATCRKGYNEVTVVAGQGSDVIVEGCSTETMAVVDPHTLVVQGCLTETGDEVGRPDSTFDRRVSELHTCAAALGPFKIHVYDPGG